MKKIWFYPILAMFVSIGWYLVIAFVGDSFIKIYV